MSRNYGVMCNVLDRIAKTRRHLEYDDFANIQQRDRVRDELKRLSADGLIDGAVEFGADGVCLVCAVKGLTDEGKAFYRLVENARVRELAISTLREADIDVPYPLLKEVCEDIVKRYVTCFIPKI